MINGAPADPIRKVRAPLDLDWQAAARKKRLADLAAEVKAEFSGAQGD